jgi:hypothetical protein
VHADPAAVTCGLLRASACFREARDRVGEAPDGARIHGP